MSSSSMSARKRIITIGVLVGAVSLAGAISAYSHHLPCRSGSVVASPDLMPVSPLFTGVQVRADGLTTNGTVAVCWQALDPVSANCYGLGQCGGCGSGAQCGNVLILIPDPQPGSIGRTVNPSVATTQEGTIEIVAQTGIETGVSTSPNPKALGTSGVVAYIDGASQPIANQTRYIIGTNENGGTVGVGANMGGAKVCLPATTVIVNGSTVINRTAAQNTFGNGPACNTIIP